MARATTAPAPHQGMDLLKLQVQRIPFDGLGYDPAALTGKRLSVQRAVEPRYTMMGLQNGPPPEAHRHDALYRLHSGYGLEYIQLCVADDAVGGTKQDVYICSLRRYRETTEAPEAYPHEMKDAGMGASGTQDPAGETQDEEEADEDEDTVTIYPATDSDDGKGYVFDHALLDVLRGPCNGGLLILDAAIGEHNAANGTGICSGNGGQQSDVSRMIGLQLAGMSEMGWISYGTDGDPAEIDNGLVFTDTEP